jgi:hypothetical protein
MLERGVDKVCAIDKVDVLCRMVMNVNLLQCSCIDVLPVWCRAVASSGQAFWTEETKHMQLRG